jgi:uncharacterized membrane protein
MNEKDSKIIFLTNIIFIIAQVLLIFLTQNKLPPQIPLFYSNPWGSNQLADKFMIAILPVLSGTILISNLFLAKISKDKVLAKLLNFASLVFSLFCLISIIKIIRLVI